MMARALHRTHNCTAAQEVLPKTLRSTVDASELAAKAPTNTMSTAVSSRVPAAAMLLLVAALLVVVARGSSYEKDPLDPSLSWYQPYDFVSFDVAGGDYAALIERVLPPLLVRWSTNSVGTTPVLHRQSVDRKPFRWLMLELTAGDDDKAMLAIRQDNLYVAGFTDKKGNWFVFYNKAGLNLIPGAATLKFSDTYGGLVGGFRQLGNLYVGRDTTVRAVKEMANFVVSPTEDEGCIARAVAVMAVTFCEALRFKPVMLTIRDNWQHGVFAGGLNGLVIRWGKMSCAVILSVQNNGRWWQSNEAKELSNDGYDEATVREEVLLLLWPSCTQRITWLKG